MRTGKELLIASTEYAREVRWKSWFHLWSTLGLLAVLATVASLNVPWFVCVPASLLAGLVIVRGFIIYHDYMHGAILQRSLVAKIVMYLYGMMVLSPPSAWKHSHDDHHKHNAKRLGPARGTYPVMTVEAYANASFGERLSYNIQRHPITMVLGYLTVFLWEFCLRAFSKNPRKHFDGLIAPLLHGGVAVALCLISWQAMWLGLILPMSIAGALGCYLFYAQHNFPGVKRRHDKHWDHTYAALNSSSYMKMNPVMDWLTGSIGYHHVHHLNAKIPFYRLAEAMAGIDELQSPNCTTLHPREIYRCLQANLWDEQAERFVPYRAAKQWKRRAFERKPASAQPLQQTPAA